MKCEWTIVCPEFNRVCSSWWKLHRTNVVHVGVEYNTKDFQRDAIDRHSEIMCLTQRSDDLIGQINGVLDLNVFGYKSLRPIESWKILLPLLVLLLDFDRVVTGQP